MASWRCEWCYQQNELNKAKCTNCRHTRDWNGIGEGSGNTAVGRRIVTLNCHIKIDLDNPRERKFMRMFKERSGVTIVKARPKAAWKELFDDEPAVAPSNSLHIHSNNILFISGCGACDAQWRDKHTHEYPTTYAEACEACKVGHRIPRPERSYGPAHTHNKYDKRITWSANCLACPSEPPKSGFYAPPTRSYYHARHAPETDLHTKLELPAKIEEQKMPSLEAEKESVDVQP